MLLTLRVNDFATLIVFALFLAFAQSISNIALFKQLSRTLHLFIEVHCVAHLKQLISIVMTRQQVISTSLHMLRDILSSAGCVRKLLQHSGFTFHFVSTVVLRPTNKIAAFGIDSLASIKTLFRTM
jgi:hypothetical protein